MEPVRIEEGSGWRGKPNNLWIVAAIILLIASVGAGVVLALYVIPYFTKEQYGVVFDAGSTHSDATLFRWPGAKLKGTGEVVEVTRCDVDANGISDNADNPTQTEKDLSACLEQSKRKVPKDLVSVTPVYLGATAGMRLLPKEKAEPIFASIASLFEKSGLKYEDGQARIISDQEEGMFAWITANLLLGKLGQSGTRTSTMGTLDMGGASTQIAFETQERADNPVNEDYGNLRLYGFDFPVFAHSYLCWGTKEATRRYRSIIVLESGGQTTVDDPCHLTGKTEDIPASEIFNQSCTMDYPSGINANTMLHFQGKGDPDQCEKFVRQQLNVTQCKSMFGGKNCLDTSVIPKIKGEFMGISSYFHTTNFLQITDVSRAEFRQKGKNFCKLTYDEAAAMKGQAIKHSKGFCYNIHLQTILLQDIYGFNTDEQWKKVSFIRTIGGVTTGWALGFMANATNVIPTEAVRVVSSSLFAGLFVFFVIVAIACSVLIYLIWTRTSSRGIRSL